jgi:hypothetical protein
MEHAALNPRPGALLVIALATIGTGGLLGAATNAVNGAVSPIYFVNILRWEHVAYVWRAAIAQGIFEGFIYGTVFAIIFTLVVGLVSKARATLGFALKHLATAGGVALLCWCVGGLLAMGLATLSPGFYRNTFTGVPNEFEAMLRYAWVGGSIWGVMFGAVLSAVIACTMAAADWRRLNRTDTKPAAAADRPALG